MNLSLKIYLTKKNEIVPPVKVTINISTKGSQNYFKGKPMNISKNEIYKKLIIFNIQSLNFKKWQERQSLE